MVFVGYGLKIPEKNLDELAGQDLKGKVAVYIAGSPSDIPTALASHYQTMAERWKALKAAGAIGIVSILNPASMDVPWSRISLNRNHPSIVVWRPTDVLPQNVVARRQAFNASLAAQVQKEDGTRPVADDITG